jgi:hypothetical protein
VRVLRSKERASRRFEQTRYVYFPGPLKKTVCIFSGEEKKNYRRRKLNLDFVQAFVCQLFKLEAQASPSAIFDEKESCTGRMLSFEYFRFLL